MTNDQLVAELEHRGLVSPEAIAKLKRETVVSGRPIEDLLHDRQLVPDEAIAGLKSEIFKIPYQKVDAAAINAGLLKIIPEDTVRTYGVVPLSKQGDTLVVGMVHPDDTKAHEALKFIARRERANLGVYVIGYGDWQDALRRYSPYKSNIEAVVSSLNLRVGEGRKLVSLEEAAQAVEEAPIIKIVSDTFREAVNVGASDVHIEPQLNYLRIRFRVNGKLREMTSLPVELSQSVISRIKVMSNLKLDENRTPQDGRFRTKIFDREVDFRVATFPTPLGEKIAIRVLDPLQGLKSLEELGLVGESRRIVEEGLRKPFGMILITGPTGSGKTTTLYALLQRLNDESSNLVSLEDPVEYFISGVNQSQVRPEIGYDFVSGLRQILRQDPDVIMVGEIRDTETAGLAVQAALTGHIVLSTLHTNNVAGVIPRLIDMKVEPFLIPVSVNVLVAQRLVGILCDGCKVPEEAPPDVQDIVKRSLQDVSAELAKKFSPPYSIYRARGCSACQGKGIVGRMGIFEAMKMTSGLEDVIGSGPTLQKINKESKAQGMLTLRQDGVLKALAGQVSMEEVLRTTAD